MYSFDWLSFITQRYLREELIQICKGLNKAYNIYDPEEVRWNKIAYELFRTEKDEIERIKQIVNSNQFVSELLLHYYPCERVVKYYFIRKLKDQLNHIVAFEMAIGDSRVDICRINGGSYAYEIKTEYDTFERLATQMKDYQQAFEKVYVIVPVEKAQEVVGYIPPSCGIIAYRLNDNRNIVFSYKRKALKNKCDIDLCLQSLSSSELSKLLRSMHIGDSGTKKERLEKLMRYSRKNEIWLRYKALLKNKYHNQWSFLLEHFDDILPIDVQSFFSSNLSPDLLYQSIKKSSTI